MKILRAIIWSVVAFLSLSGQGQIQPVSAEVVDASNNLLGVTYTHNTTGVVVMLEVDSHVIAPRVRTTHLESTNPVYFASSDCSGQAFGAWSPSDPFEPFSVVTLSNSVYAGPRATQQAVMTQSRLDPGTNGCQVAALLRSDLVPVALVRDLSPHFQPPFSIRAAAAPASATAPALSVGAISFLALALAVASLYLLRSNS